MKKILFLVAIFAILLYGCKGAKELEKATTAQQEAVTPEPAAETTPSLPATTETPPVAENKTHEAMTANTTTAQAEPSPTVETTMTAAGDRPDFEFKYPVEGIKIHGRILSVSLLVKNFTFGTEGDPSKAGEGHLHFYFDDRNGTIMVYKASYTVSDLVPGNRTLTTEMVNNDHSSIGVRKSVTFEVPEPGFKTS